MITPTLGARVRVLPKQAAIPGLSVTLGGGEGVILGISEDKQGALYRVQFFKGKQRMRVCRRGDFLVHDPKTPARTLAGKFYETPKGLKPRR